MAKATFGFHLTVHAIDRLYERHPHIFADPKREGKPRVDAAYRVLDDAVEERSFINNSSFMLYLHERYGYEKRYRTFVNGNVLFVGFQEGVKQLIVTTLLVDSNPGTKHATRRAQAWKAPTANRPKTQMQLRKQERQTDRSLYDES